MKNAGVNNFTKLPRKIFLMLFNSKADPAKKFMAAPPGINHMRKAVDFARMDSLMERMGEVVDTTFGQSDSLRVVLGVKTSPAIKYILIAAIGQKAFAVDREGYLVIPRQADQQKAVEALNLVLGMELRLLRGVECDRLEEVVGIQTLQQKIRALWTSDSSHPRKYTNALDPGERPGVCPSARLVVGRLAMTMMMKKGEYFEAHQGQEKERPKLRMTIYLPRFIESE